MIVLLLITLILEMTTDGPRFVVWSSESTHIYVQVDALDGATVQSPTIYQLDLGKGEGFGRTIQASAPGSIRVRVWDGGEQPSADQSIILPAHRMYAPLIIGP